MAIDSTALSGSRFWSRHVLLSGLKLQNCTETFSDVVTRHKQQTLGRLQTNSTISSVISKFWWYRSIDNTLRQVSILSFVNTFWLTVFSPSAVTSSLGSLSTNWGTQRMRVCRPSGQALPVPSRVSLSRGCSVLRPLLPSGCYAGHNVFFKIFQRLMFPGISLTRFSEPFLITPIAPTTTGIISVFIPYILLISISRSLYFYNFSETLVKVFLSEDITTSMRVIFFSRLFLTMSGRFLEISRYVWIGNCHR